MPKPMPAALKKALVEAGATLIRHKRHNIYRLPAGQLVVLPKSPRNGANGRTGVATIKRALGR